MFEWLNRFALTRWLAGGPRDSSPATSSRAAGPVGRMVRARYEAAETTSENAPLWGLTDYLSAKAANNFQVRRQLKIRSRYERANNSYYAGIVDTIASDLIGTGPRLQVRTGNPRADALIQQRWHDWAASINLAEKLRTMTKAKIVDGEAFALFVTNRELKRTWQKLPLEPGIPTAEIRVQDQVQLDMVVIESDQVMTPSAQFVSMFWVDGMLLDPLGNVIEYHVLRQHPGDLFIANNLSPLDYDRWPAKFVAHWFKKDRPGQCRGVPEVTPSLDQFGFLRRFEKAVMQAAESAADMAVLLTTKAPADSDPSSQNNSDIGAGLYPGETMPLDRGQMTALPDGYDAKQMKAEQPSTQYEMFERLTVRQIVRPLGFPLGLALGDHSSYNYASGRLDHLGHHRKQRVDRHDCDTAVLQKAYGHWAEEGANIPGYFPTGVNVAEAWHHWHWQANERIDLVKEATADGLDLRNNTSTLAEKYAEQGKEWEAEIRQRAAEIKLCKELGITPDEAAPKQPQQPNARPAKRGMSGAKELKRLKAKAAQTETADRLRTLFAAELDRRGVGRALAAAQPPQSIVVQTPQQPITVNLTQAAQEPPTVNNHVEAVSGPVIAGQPGPKGDAGDRGPAGKDGRDGASGAAGPRGEKGEATVIVEKITAEPRTITVTDRDRDGNLKRAQVT